MCQNPATSFIYLAASWYVEGLIIDNLPVVRVDFTHFLKHICRICADCHLPGTICMWADCTACAEGCASAVSECGGCLGGAGEAGLPLIFVMALVVLGLFTVIGIFYSVLVATMVCQRIWQRHYHILAKRMLTKVRYFFLLPSSSVLWAYFLFFLILAFLGVCGWGCRRGNDGIWLVATGFTVWACPAAEDAWSAMKAIMALLS